MGLAQILINFAKDKLTPNNDWYCWRPINTKRLPGGVNLPIGNQYAQNVALKFQLNELWKTSNDEGRYDIAHYYVAIWGGVRGNKEKTLRDYVTKSPEDIITQKGKQGVASWSKVLCVRDPTKYAIFDARVSVSINSLQVIHKISQPILFPLLLGQNKTIKLGNQRIRKFAKDNSWTKAKDSYYRDYLSLLHRAAETCKVPIHTIEMLLFSQAESLLAEAFPNQG